MTYQAKVGRKQGATEIFIDAGGTLNVASGSLTLPPNLKRGYIPIDLFAGRALASGENFNAAGPWVGTATQSNAAMGGILTGGGDPSLGTISSGAQNSFINWASGTLTAVRFPPIPLPPDFNTATDFKVHTILERASDQSTNNVMDHRVWVGANATEMGTTGSTISSTPTEQSITVGATALAGNGNWISVQLVPGTHNQCAVRCHAAWISYDRKTS